MLQPIRTLLDEPPGAPALSGELRRLYGGDLCFPAAPSGRPYVIGNFVSTLDGIVSYRLPGKAGGGEISGHNLPDRFIMGLLRASADAVMVGSGTLQATAPAHLWTAAHIYPEVAALYDDYRKNALGKPRPPATVIVSASGMVDLDRPLFRDSGITVRILTTAAGSERLRAAGAPAAWIVSARPSETWTPASMLEYLHHQCGVRLLLHEGGPALFGQFVEARLMDEFFLTLAPQLAGSDSQHLRPSMISGTAFSPQTAPWLRLSTVKQNGDHLYLRYRQPS